MYLNGGVGVAPPCHFDATTLFIACIMNEWATKSPKRHQAASVRLESHVSSVTPSMLSSLQSHNDACSICLDSMQADVCKLPCSHRFHHGCLAELRLSCLSQRCPLCRAILPPGPKEIFDDAVNLYSLLENQVERGESSWSCLSSSEQQIMNQIIKLWEDASAQGLREAMYNLAIMYRRGRGVQQCDFKAVKWYSKAAKLGHLSSMNNLGFMYNHNRGTDEANEADAVKWYRMAADKGSADAQVHCHMILHLMLRTANALFFPSSIIWGSCIAKAEELRKTNI